MKAVENLNTWEETENKEKIFGLIVSDDTVETVTVTEYRDFLNKLIEEGYGDYTLEADTQDGTTYNVRNEVTVYRKSETVIIN